MYMCVCGVVRGVRFCQCLVSYVNGIGWSKNDKLVSTETISPMIQGRQEEAEAKGFC